MHRQSLRAGITSCPCNVHAGNSPLPIRPCHSRRQVLRNPDGVLPMLFTVQQLGVGGQQWRRQRSAG